MHRPVSPGTPGRPAMCILVLKLAKKKPRPKPGLNEAKGLLCEEKAPVVLDQNLKVVFRRPPKTLLEASNLPLLVLSLPAAPS